MEYEKVAKAARLVISQLANIYRTSPRRIFAELNLDDDEGAKLDHIIRTLEDYPDLAIQAVREFDAI